MGQYHILVNFTKREFVNPHKLGNGMKLWEQVGWEHAFSNVTHMLIAGSSGRGGGDFSIDGECKHVVGRWAGDKITLLGDYSEVGDCKNVDEAEFILAMHDIWGSDKMPRILQQPRDEYGRFASGPRISKYQAYEDISDLVAKAYAELFEVRFAGEGWKDVSKVVPQIEFDTVIRNSTLVAKLKYENDGTLTDLDAPHHGTLSVSFVSNPTAQYVYANVPSKIAWAFLGAASKGRFFHEFIKGKYPTNMVK